MDVKLFDFILPKSRIALRPKVRRETAKMLVVGPMGIIEDHKIKDFSDFLDPKDIVIFNDTKVIPSRLFGHRGKAKIEVTLHKQITFSKWAAFARPAKKLKPGDTIDFGLLEAIVVEKLEGGEVHLEFVHEKNLLDKIKLIGQMPLPPYIAGKRPVDAADLDDYQTSFARHEGAVAAPTAGLHFDNKAMDKLTKKGIEFEFLTLHVGAGTFLPVKVENTSDHKMHSEWGEITGDVAAKLNEVRARGGRIVAVGTTSLRLLESATTEEGVIQPFQGDTDIFIQPGYSFKAVDLLLTNFHLPKSTLFMLVSGFSGLERMKEAYAHAVKSKYSFYSYGDACLLYPSRK